MGKLLDTIWPDHCALCVTALRPRLPHLLCTHCWQDLPWLGTQCRHCASPLSTPGVCGACLQHPLVHGRTLAALEHRAEGQYLVAKLKFQRGFREAQTLGFCMSGMVQFNYAPSDLPTALLSTPMSWWGLAKRGYNQSSLLAQVLSKNLAIPIIRPLRRRQGAAQRTLNRRARHKLGASAFPANKTLQHRHVAIVDDVLTTGSTVQAMATALTHLGARRVDVWCGTRAVATVGNEHTL